MYTDISNNFKDLMLSGSGTITSKLVFDDFELSGDDIYSISYKAGSSDGNSIAPGTVYIPELEAEISVSDRYFRNRKMSWYVGLSGDGVSFEYAKVCTVWIKSVEKNIGTIKLTAYSKMYNLDKSYISSLKYPTNVSQVLNEISSKTGITIDTSELPLSLLSTTIADQPAGYTYRQVVGQIAGLCGCFAVPDRDDNKLMFKWYEDNNLVIEDDFDEPQTEDSDIIIDALACNVNGKWITTTLKPWVMEWSCIYMTGDILEQLLAKMSGLTYRVGSFNLLSGNILIDPWDIVTLSYSGETYKMPVGLLEHKYDGGLSTSIQTPGDTDGETTLSSINTSEQTTNRLTAEIVNAKEVLAEKVVAEVLEAAKAEIDNLVADKASIQQLEAVQASINILSVNKADITDLDAIRADIIELNTNKANISDLEAAVGNISNLSSAVANITTILSGQVGTGTLQAINITAENTTISEAAIRELIAAQITVNDLCAGKISTDKFEITSDDGGLRFSGATAQWKDKNGVVRVQIGKDAQGNFTFTLFDATGKGVLIDSTGIHKNAVPDGLIVDSMVSDNANISGKKLDIDSVIESINEDGSTSLKSSKVLIDTTGQTLDVALKSVETKTLNLEKTITSQGESITVIQGQIKQKIWKSDITTALQNTEEEISILIDQYNSVSDTLFSHSQEIADIQTRVETKVDESTVSEIESRVSSFEQNLDGFMFTVSESYSAINSDLSDINKRLYSAESNIIQNADNIALKVEKNGVISAINQSSEKITIQANKVNIDGAVELINNGYTTKINGNAIQTGSITADKISVESLQAISAQIGGFTIGDTYLSNDNVRCEMTSSISITLSKSSSTNMYTGSGTLFMTDMADLSSKYPIRVYNADTGSLLGTISVASAKVTLISPSSSNSGLTCTAQHVPQMPGVGFSVSRGSAYTLNLKVVWYKKVEGSVYLGIDRISCGDNFSVDLTGNLKATSGNIAGFNINDHAIMFEGSAAGQSHYSFLNANMLTYNYGPAYYSILLGVDTGGYVEPDARENTPSLFISHDGRLVSTYDHNLNDSLEIRDAGIYMNSNRYIRSQCSTATKTGYYIICGQNSSGEMTLGEASQPSNTKIYAATSYQIKFLIGSTTKAYISSSGLTNSSDERLKSDIEDIDDKYVQIADKLKPKTFKYKDDGLSETNMGFIAQDLEKVVSELGIDSESFAPLGKDEEGYMGINYIQLIPILWAKVQQLSKEIEKLKSKEDNNNVNKL